MNIDPLVLVAGTTVVVGVVTVLTCMRAAPSNQISVSDSGVEGSDGKPLKTGTSVKKKKSKSKSKSKSSNATLVAQSSGDESGLVRETVVVPTPQSMDKVAKASDGNDEDEEDDENFVDPLAMAQSKKKNKKTKKGSSVAAAPQSVHPVSIADERKEKALPEDDNTPPALSPADPEVFEQIPDSTTAPLSGFDGWAVVEDKRKVKGRKEAEEGEAFELEVTPNSAPVVVEEEVASSPAAPVVESISNTITVDSKKLGLLIGPKGVTKIGLQTATNTEISMPKVEKDHVGEVDIVVTGQTEGVAKAIHAMKELCTKGYCNLLAAEDFHEGYAAVNPRYLPDIIGKGGSCIKAIQAHTGVKISTPSNFSKTNDKGETVTPSKVKISLAGSRDKVTQARQLILDLCRYYHTPVTHPGISHVEMDIDSTYYNYIIGAKGSEIKHIQSNYKVSVHIPNQESVNQNVLIVGPQENITQAEKHIIKLMEKADTVAAERAAAKAAGVALGERAKAKEMAQAGVPSSSKQKTLGGGGGDPNARPPGANKEEPEAEWVSEFAPRSSTMQIDLGASIPAKAKFSAPAPAPTAKSPTDASDNEIPSLASDSSKPVTGASVSGEGSTRPAWGGMGSLGMTH